MTDLKSFFLELIRLSVFDPRSAARIILGMKLASDVLWSTVLLVVILSVLLTYVTMLAAAPVTMFGMGSSPFFLAMFMASNMVFLIFALFWTGKAMGGQGELQGFIALVTWLQTLLLLAQVVQTIMAIVSPLLSSLCGIGSLLFGMWILVQFVTEAHKFKHWGIGLLSLVLAVLGVSAGFSILLSLIGVGTLGISGYV